MERSQYDPDPLLNTSVSRGMFNIREKTISYEIFRCLEWPYGWGKHDMFDRFLTKKCALLHGQTPRNGDGLISVEEFALMGLLQTKVHKETAWWFQIL